MTHGGSPYHNQRPVSPRDQAGTTLAADAAHWGSVPIMAVVPAVTITPPMQWASSPCTAPRHGADAIGGKGCKLLLPQSPKVPPFLLQGPQPPPRSPARVARVTQLGRRGGEGVKTPY
jgi:hypothetical protein